MIDADTPAALVGRDRELTVLTETLRRVRRGGQIVVIEGEAGIGKSRLLEAGLDHARAAGTTVLVARADELELLRPLAPVLDLLRDAADPDAPEPLAGATTPNPEGAGLDV
ncbi:MAG TPA: AAA family ATPase, partial [Solirubrobacteraceae bacterium]|nr:AAA family ATPase [Solirubrobacteraceae bacterium]